MNHEDVLLKRMGTELERCGYPTNPAELIGRKFRLVIDNVHELGTSRFAELNKLEEADSCARYVLHGTIQSLDFFMSDDSGEFVNLYVESAQCALGKIDMIIPEKNGEVRVLLETPSVLRKFPVISEEDMMGRLTLL